MNNIVEVSHILLKNFLHLVCTSDDICPDHIHYEGDEDFEFEVAEDTSRCQWYVGFLVDGGMSHTDVRDCITRALGVALTERERGDLKDRKVNNWTFKNVRVVQLDNHIELFQNYKKV